MPAHQRFAIDRPLPGGFIDDVTVEPSMLLAVEGWLIDVVDPVDDLVEVRWNGTWLRLVNAFRVRRTDVTSQADTGELFHGVVWQFRLPEEPVASVELVVVAGGQQVLVTAAESGGTAAPYDLFLDTPCFHGRAGVYSTGRPDPTINSEALAIAMSLPEAVLDFGCGSGALVRALRDAGRDAAGLEVDRPAIVEALEALGTDVADHVRLTSGGFPLPLADRSYASVVATEVLEHIEDLVTATDELKRIADREIFVTVPDASAIPALSPHAVVPWHLLEATHVNFFSARSIESLFTPTFEVVQRYRLGRVVVNGTLSFTSLAVRLRRIGGSSA